MVILTARTFALFAAFLLFPSIQSQAAETQTNLEKATAISPEKDFINRLDPDLRSALDSLPPGFYKAIGNDPAMVRLQLDRLRSEQRPAEIPKDMTFTSKTISGEDEEQIRLLIYQPKSDSPLPALLWFHGGGHVIGTAECHDSCVPLAEATNTAIISVEYPLAPEFTYEFHISAAAQALDWVSEHAEDLGIDPNRIGVGGGSAGAGLAAGLAIYNRDTAGPGLVFQLLLYPMLDDTHNTPSGYAVTHPAVWNRETSLKAWAMYLGDEYGSESVSPYAAPSRAKDLSGLPPAYIMIGTEDLFRDEAIDYAQRLMAAGVATELEVHPGVFHGANVLAPEADVSQRMTAAYTAALERGLYR